MTLKRKNEIKMVKNNTVQLLILKSVNGLKTSYGETFDKLLVFFDQKYHFIDNLDTKTQNEIKMVKNKTCAAFNPKTRKWT